MREILTPQSSLEVAKVYDRVRFDSSREGTLGSWRTGPLENSFEEPSDPSRQEVRATQQPLVMTRVWRGWPTHAQV